MIPGLENTIFWAGVFGRVDNTKIPGDHWDFWVQYTIGLSLWAPETIFLFIISMSRQLAEI